MTVGALADEVGVSRRTVLRDVRSLRDQGFVIGSEPGRGGGLRLDPLSVQTTAKLTVTEAFALLISVASMRAAGNLPFSGYADAGLAKIERALPPRPCGICAVCWTACTSDRSLPIRISRVSAPSTPTCCPPSRRRFWGARV